MEIYVGNFSRDVTEADLQAAFAAFGKVDAVKIISDRFTGEPRGFGFVTMPSASEGQAAIAGLNGKELKGRPLTVNQARPRSDEGRGGFGGRGGRGGGGGGPRRY